MFSKRFKFNAMEIRFEMDKYGILYPTIRDSKGAYVDAEAMIFGDELLISFDSTNTPDWVDARRIFGVNLEKIKEAISRGKEGIEDLDQMDIPLPQYGFPSIEPFVIAVSFNPFDKRRKTFCFNQDGTPTSGFTNVSVDWGAEGPQAITVSIDLLSTPIGEEFKTWREECIESLKIRNYVEE